MSQLALAGMPQRLFACTPSRLTTWLDCPRRYRMTYVDRPSPPKGPPWAHNAIGTAVHLALRSWWMEPHALRTPERARVLVAGCWTGDGFRDREQALTALVAAQDMVARYVAGLDPDDEPVGLERTVATRTDGLALSGRVDRIDRRGDELVVVDYKTGRHVLSTDDARGSLALAVYAVAAERTLRAPCRRVELHHLPSGDVVVWEHTDASLARHLERAEAIAAEAAEAERRWADGDASAFPARPGSLCSWCDFHAHCAEGRATGSRREGWAAVAAG